MSPYSYPRSHVHWKGRKEVMALFLVVLLIVLAAFGVLKLVLSVALGVALGLVLAMAVVGAVVGRRVRRWLLGPRRRGARLRTCPRQGPDPCDPPPQHPPT